MILRESGWNPPPDRPPWPAGEVHVWRTTLDWPASSITDLEQTLSKDEVERMQRFRFEKDRMRCLVGRGVLRRLLGHYLELPPHLLRFDYTSFGKPHLGADLAQRSLQFNVSHSGELLLIAIAAERAIGVDIEQIRTDVEVKSIAAHSFSSSEQTALGRLAGGPQIEAFFYCWTRKEAYIKARGEGLSLPLDQFDVSLMPDEEARLIETRPDPAEARRWRLANLDVADGYKAALAAEGADWTLKCWNWLPERSSQ